MKRPPEHYTNIDGTHPLLAGDRPDCCDSAHFIRRAVVAEMGFDEEAAKASGEDNGAFDMQKAWPLPDAWLDQMAADAISLLDVGEMPDLSSNDRFNILARAAHQLEEEGHSLASLLRLTALEAMQCVVMEQTGHSRVGGILGAMLESIEENIPDDDGGDKPGPVH